MLKFENTFNAGHVLTVISLVSSFGGFYALTNHKLDTLTKAVELMTSNYSIVSTLSVRSDERIRFIEQRLDRLEMGSGRKLP